MTIGPEDPNSQSYRSILGASHLKKDSIKHTKAPLVNSVIYSLYKLRKKCITKEQSVDE